MTIAEIQQEILRMKKEQDVCILAHAYQGQEILEVADYTGDSYGLSVQASKRDCSIVEHLQFACPDKKFYPVTVQLTCMNMKVTTLMDIYNCLKGEGGEEIFLPQNVMDGAGRCIHRMVELGG